MDVARSQRRPWRLGMATLSLATRITQLEDAIHQLAVNLVASYSVGEKQLKYHDLPSLRAELAILKQEQKASSAGAGRSLVSF